MFKRELSKSGFLKFLVVFLLVSCATAAVGFSLANNASNEADVRSLIGEIQYTTGFYMPSVDDVLELSLVSSSGFELSHQKVVNIRKFPLQFVMRYDFSEVVPNEDYSIRAVLVTSSGVFEGSSRTDLTKDKSQTLITLWGSSFFLPQIIYCSV